jgi:hypothetical protein
MKLFLITGRLALPVEGLLRPEAGFMEAFGCPSRFPLIF